MDCRMQLSRILCSSFLKARKNARERPKFYRLSTKLRWLPMVAVHSFSEVTERLHSVRQPQLLVPVRLCGVLQFSDSLQNGALGSFNALQQLLTVKLRDSAV